MTPSPKIPQRKTSNRQVTARGKHGSIRIIAGQHRGRKLPVLMAEGLRPTADRVKETLFNWLMGDIAGARVLDMFAGAGSLGFEAISRSAAYVLMIENSPLIAAQLKHNLQRIDAQTKADIICGDAFTVLNNKTASFDIVFVDPPFHKDLAMRAINTLFARNMLKQNALIYIESEASLREMCHVNLVKIKESMTKEVNYSLYRVTAG